jgi:hypothetical protein
MESPSCKSHPCAWHYNFSSNKPCREVTITSVNTYAIQYHIHFFCQLSFYVFRNITVDYDNAVIFVEINNVRGILHIGFSDIMGIILAVRLCGFLEVLSKWITYLLESLFSLVRYILEVIWQSDYKIGAGCNPNVILNMFNCTMLNIRTRWSGNYF